MVCMMDWTPATEQAKQAPRHPGLPCGLPSHSSGAELTLLTLSSGPFSSDHSGARHVVTVGVGPQCLVWQPAVAHDLFLLMLSRVGSGLISLR